MTTNPVRQLGHFGQSAWLDQINRKWFDDGQLAAFVDDDDIRGVTSNPSIFDAAISGGNDYDDEMSALARQGMKAREIYDALTLADIRAACDIFMPLYESSGEFDGFVSHEVPPDLAYDMWGTVHEARRLWLAIGRPNAMIKIPATAEGVQAGRQCLIEGINVNFTLMFSMTHYDAVAEAYMGALEARAASGDDVATIASVASFFISRVDTYVDRALESRLQREAATLDVRRIRSLLGSAAVANAKATYRRYQQLFQSARFTSLESTGARSQRVLWASTSTKNPDYSDVKYVDELVGPNTVNTIPLPTLLAYRDHGQPRSVLTEDFESAEECISDLAVLGIDLNQVGDVLLTKGVEAFQASMDKVLGSIETRRAELAGN